MAWQRGVAFFLIVVGIAALLVFAGVFTRPLAIHGYDGLESYVSRVESPYDETKIVQSQEFPSVGFTYDPNPFWPSSLADPTGFGLEMNQPQVLNYEVIDSIEKEEIIEEGGIKLVWKRIWSVQIAHLEQNVHVWTTGFGLAAITSTKIWIALHENPYTVFQNPDESEAYTLNIFTLEQPQRTGGYAEVYPVASGIDLEIHTVRTGDVPQWIRDSGYTGALSNFKDVEYALELIKVEKPFAGLGQTDIEWSIGIDVLLFGFWEQTKPYREVEYETWWEELLGAIWNALATPLALIIIVVAIIGTVIIIIRAPSPQIIVLGLGAVWVAAVFALIVIGMSVVVV